MKLQLALDELTLPEALVFIDKVVDDVDIIEVGYTFSYSGRRERD